ncbi:tetratricopeptide repeat protein [Hathewaya histolytica]|uniref:tetratricopeptide repeat protein n=1 Tax=Hathewaya histolytica TaxID=1498 RepID=UPI003B66F7A1
MFSDEYLYRNTLGINSKTFPYFYVLEKDTNFSTRLYKVYIFKNRILFVNLGEQLNILTLNNKKFIQNICDKEIFYDNLSLDTKTYINTDKHNFQITSQLINSLIFKKTFFLKNSITTHSGKLYIKFKNSKSRSFTILGRQYVEFIFSECKSIFKNCKLLNSKYNCNILNIINYYENLGHYSMGLKILESFISKEKLDSKTKSSLLLKKVKLLQNINEYDKSLNLLISLKNDFKDENKFLNEVSYMYILLEKFDKSLEITNRVLNSGRNNDIAYFNLGKALIGKTEYAKALKALNNSYENGYNLPNIYLEKSIALFNLKQYKPSLKFIDIYLKKFPEDIKAMIIKAENLYFLGEYKKEIFILDKILTLDKTILHAYCLKADALLQLGNEIDALFILNKTIRTCPDYPLAYYIKACYYAKNRELEKAIQNLKMSIDIYPNYIDYALDDSRLNFIKFTSEFSKLIIK